MLVIGYTKASIESASNTDILQLLNQTPYSYPRVSEPHTKFRALLMMHVQMAPLADRPGLKDSTRATGGCL